LQASRCAAENSCARALVKPSVIVIAAAAMKRKRDMIVLDFGCRRPGAAPMHRQIPESFDVRN
jgi:hypothetical protein